MLRALFGWLVSVCSQVVVLLRLMLASCFDDPDGDDFQHSIPESPWKSRPRDISMSPKQVTPLKRRVLHPLSSPNQLRVHEALSGGLSDCVDLVRPAKKAMCSSSSSSSMSLPTPQSCGILHPPAPSPHADPDSHPAPQLPVMHEPSASAPLRRRIASKQSQTSKEAVTVEQELAAVHSMFKETSDEVAADRNWDKVRELMRTEFRKGMRASASQDEDEASSWTDQRAASRAAFSKLSAAEKMKILSDMLATGKLPVALRPLAQQKLVQMTEGSVDEEPEKVDKRLTCSTVLFTWNGEWGKIQSAPHLCQDRSLDEVVQSLRAHPVVLFIWSQAQEYMEKMVKELFLVKWAVSLELCTRTLGEGQLRVHVHAFWVFNKKTQLCRNLIKYTFGNSIPHRSHDQVTTRARGRAHGTAMNGGLYYVAAPKLGSLFSRCSVAPFKDFVVNPEWITVLWQTGKLDNETAIDQYTVSKKDVKRHVQNVRDQEQLEREIKMKKSLESAQRSINQVMKPRKYVPLVDRVWLQEQNLCLDRQRFLVLDGPSRLGKTQFALQIKGAFRTLEVNCAQCLKEPDLRAYEHGRHEAIIFDEAHCQMVVNCKRLFQAPPAMVQMASSATNCFGYSVCVHRVLLIVCSNKWKVELDELPRADADWLERNSVYVAVIAPMWNS